MYKSNTSRQDRPCCLLYDTADKCIVPSVGLGGSTHHWNTTIVKFDVIDHADVVEVVVSFQTMPGAIVLGCRVAFWGPSAVGHGVKDAAAAESHAVTAGICNDKPSVLAFLRFVHLRGAHDI